MLVTYNKDVLEDKVALGANLYYIEILKLMNNLKREDIEFVPHSFREIVLGKSKLPKLKGDDVVLSNVGPYAWYYHYLREKNNLNFRIIRDVQTSLWTDYFLQEDLCRHYTRDGDSVIFLSNFNKILFMKFFPDSVRKNNSFVFNTCGLFFPQSYEKPKKENEELVLGVLGSINRDKNFDQALEVFIRVYKNLGGNVKMLVAGPTGPLIYDKEIFAPKKVRQKLGKNGVNPINYQHINNGQFLKYENIWNMLGKIDVFLFPSVSIRESFGRVLAEASYAGCKVVSSNYAAAPEILGKNNLVKVDFYKKIFNLVVSASLGKVNVDEMTEKCCNYEKLPKKYINMYAKIENFLKILENRPVKNSVKINNEIKKYIKNITIIKPIRNNSNEKLIKILGEQLIRLAEFNRINISNFVYNIKYSVYAKIE